MTGSRRPGQPVRGFTLVEATVVIAVTGIIAAMVALFIRAPVQSYVDATRRAELTDVADTALRRIARDVRLALPNSVRVTTAGGVSYLEFLQTSGGGRYRAELTDTGSGDALDFSSADTTFDVLGPAVALPAGDLNRVAVFNLGIPGADAYAGDNIANGPATVAGNTLTIPSTLFPFESPSRRFQIVAFPVTYECNPAAGTLTRYWNYPIAAAQPTPPAGGGNALLANGVSACSFTFNPVVVAQRAGLVTLHLTVTRLDESVRLYHAVHVSNVP